MSSRFTRRIPHFLALLLLLLLAHNARAAFPDSVTYQGSLKLNGAPANGTYTMEFRLTDAAGATLYWTSGPKSVTVKEGLYRVDLSTLSAINWGNITPYIETKVNGNTMLPREKLSSTPYAIVAQSIAPGTQILAQNGTSASPGIAFASSTGTGFFTSNPGFGHLQAMSNGTPVWTSNGPGGNFWIYRPTLFPEGTWSSPAISFASAPTSGLTRYGATAFGLVNNGQQRLLIGDNGVTTVGNQHLFPDGSGTVPGLAFSNEANTGFWRPGAGSIFCSVNGVNQWGSNGTQVAFMKNANPNADGLISLGQSGARWSAVWAMNGAIQTSSSRLKRDIREITVSNGASTLTPLSEASISIPSYLTITTAGDRKSIEKIPGLNERFEVPRAIIYKWKNPANAAQAEADFISFVGDDLPLEAHALREDGTRDPEAFYTGAVVGILCAKVRAQDALIQNLSARLAALENNSAPK